VVAVIGTHLDDLAVPPFALAAFALFLFVAAAIDLRSRRIPNGLLLIGLVLSIGWQLWARGFPQLSDSFLGLGLGLVLMLPGWLFRFTGGGDVKLFAVVGSFLGIPAILHAFVLSILVGAIVGVVYSVYAWTFGAASPLARYGTMLTAFFSTGRFSYIRPDADEAVGRRFPLAPAIAVGSVIAGIWLS
jgi:prepilin peptidase CpaA